jgi:hypothetical protein
MFSVISENESKKLAIFITTSDWSYLLAMFYISTKFVTKWVTQW